jgi:Fe-S-cluster containining protein
VRKKSRLRTPDFRRKSRAAADRSQAEKATAVAFSGVVRAAMSTPSFDCVSCGACCFSRNARYLQLLPWDFAAGRASGAMDLVDQSQAKEATPAAPGSLPPESLFTEGGNTYVRFACGHCVHLDLSDGKAVCQVYEDRPEACRAFRAGSFECVRARRANGIMGANVRDREGEPA